MNTFGKNQKLQWDSIPRSTDYEAVALPLDHTACILYFSSMLKYDIKI